MPNPPIVRQASAAALGMTGGRPLTVGALLVAAALLSPVRTSAQFSVQPVIVEMVTVDGTATAVVQVRNESAGPMQLRLYAGDFDQPESGGHVFMDAGTHPSSCGDRLQFYPDGATLEREEVLDVRILMEPVDSTCWSMVFAESAARSETGLSIAQRIGVKVYGVDRGTDLEGEIRSVRVVEDTGRTVVIRFANLGDRPVRPEGEIEVRTLEGEVSRLVPVRPFSVLPGRVRETRVELAGALEPGTYVLVPILDFGGDYLAGGQAVLEVGVP